MRILVVGAGGVGAAAATIAARRGFFERFVLADIDAGRARGRPPAADPGASARLDASDPSTSPNCRHERADAILNACDPRFNPPIFDAAFEAGCHYLDMAMTLSSAAPDRPVPPRSA